MISEIVQKRIKGFDGYCVNTLGEIISYKGLTNRIMKPDVGKFGYNRVSLSKSNKKTNHLVHRLVAKAFIPNPDNKPHVNHISGDKSDNCAINLEWCTPQENMKHARCVGLYKGDGVNHTLSKLSGSQVNYIRATYALGKTTQKELGKSFGVSRPAIGYIVNRKTYTNTFIIQRNT